MVDPRVVDGGRDESLGGGPVAGEAEPAEESEVVAEPIRSGTPVPRLLFERAQSLRQARILEEVVEHVHDIVPPPLGQRHRPVCGLVPVGVPREDPVARRRPRVLVRPSLRHRVDHPERVLHLPRALVAGGPLLADETLEVRGENGELLAVAAVHPAETNRVPAHLRRHKIPPRHPRGAVRLVHRSLEHDDRVVLLLRGRRALVVLEPRLRVEQHEDVVGHLLEADHVRVFARDDVGQPVDPVHQRHVLREPHVVRQQPDLREGLLDGLVPGEERVQDPEAADRAGTQTRDSLSRARQVTARALILRGDVSVLRGGPRFRGVGTLGRGRAAALALALHALPRELSHERRRPAPRARSPARGHRPR
mmetsp:Transcript_10221/g.42159  ORF Transcript_10221/g.42159 Transcript_10221/m.42159 type:complete len:365 (+) Transcript_10221:3218-4312(+)